MKILDTYNSYEHPEIRISEIEAQGVFLSLSDKIVVEVDETISEDGGWLDFDE